jgi:hypothetical protein
MRLLESIFIQLDRENINNVEIVISDNDPDSEVISLLKSKLSSSELKNVKYHVNLLNIGFDKNLENLRQMASGKYLKIASDDDILDNGYIRNHLRTLVDKDPDIVVNEFQTFHSIPPESFDKLFPMDLNYYSPPWSFLKLQELNGRFGQVSSLTFRLALLRQIPDQPVKTNDVHLFWFYSLLEKSNLVYEKKITIFCQLGSPNFSSSLTEIVLIPYGQITAARLANIQDLDLRKKVIRDYQNYALRHLRIVPNLSITERCMIFKKLYLEFFYSLPTSLVFLPLFFVPKIVIKQLKKMIRAR